MPLLFVDSYTRNYYADSCSLASIASLILLICLILVPFFLGLATEDFWEKTAYYYEQPTVSSKNIDSKRFDYIIFAEEKNDNKMKIFTSSSTLANNYGIVSSDVCSSEDYGKSSLESVDKIIINCQNVMNDYKNLKMFFFLNYGLKDKAKLLMNTLVYIDITPTEGKNYLKGDLILNQKEPIKNTGAPDQSYYYTYFNREIDDKNYYNFPLSEGDYFPLDFLEIFKNFRNRRYVTDYEYDYDYSNSNTNNEINVEIDIPKYQKIIYQKSYFQLIKKAWVQYLYWLIPFAIVIYYFLLFVLKNQVFSSNVIDYLPLEN